MADEWLRGFGAGARARVGPAPDVAAALAVEAAADAHSRLDAAQRQAREDAAWAAAYRRQLRAQEEAYRWVAYTGAFRGEVI